MKKFFFLLLFVSVLYSCKKEVCGTCMVYEHYSHNDTTIEADGPDKYCGSSYETAKKLNETYPDTIDFEPTTVRRYAVCEDRVQ